ncbi:hypothetical protein BA190_09235 [Labrys sp. WJW]|nr:hypothetical protein BA190_09235 [Labrys sp. WJW]
MFRLPPGRLDEIQRATSFQCHKTVDYSDDECPSPGDKPQQCAGLMAVLHREGEPNQIMRVAERLQALPLDELDPRREAYATWDDVKRAHAEGIEPRR